MQMEKELNHVPRREIDRSVEVLHFVGGEDSSRRVLCLWRPQPAPPPVQRKHALPRCFEKEAKVLHRDAPQTERRAVALCRR